LALIRHFCIGVAGISWNSGLLNGKVLNNAGSGSASSSADGIIWAADNGAKAINMSYGSSSYSQTEQNAVNYAWNKGAVLVAAAGNSNTSSKFYPAAYTNVISVAATDNNDQKASFSNYGNWVLVASPGVCIASTYKNSGYAWMSGPRRRLPRSPVSRLSFSRGFLPIPTLRFATPFSAVPTRFPAPAPSGSTGESTPSAPSSNSPAGPATEGPRGVPSV
jgi:hypothetical protein